MRTHKRVNVHKHTHSHAHKCTCIDVHTQTYKCAQTHTLTHTYTRVQNAHEMILEMIAFRDPNMIPIKAFYGDDLKVNYAGKLATDSHPMVRETFEGRNHHLMSRMMSCT